MSIDDKIANIMTQQKQLKLEITELKEALEARQELLMKVTGAIEFSQALKEDDKSITEKPNKKEKKDA
jgi:hypothetical protein